MTMDSKSICISLFLVSALAHAEICANDVEGECTRKPTRVVHQDEVFFLQTSNLMQDRSMYQSFKAAATQTTQTQVKKSFVESGYNGLMDPTALVDVGIVPWIGQNTHGGEAGRNPLALLDVGQQKSHRSTWNWSEPTSEPRMVEVSTVCTTVIGLVVAAWVVYWYFAAKHSQSRGVGSDLSSLKTARLLLLCISFSVCSWGMNVVNKALVSSLNAPGLVTAAQMFMTVMGTLILARDRLEGNKEQILKWSFVPLLFFGMLCSSFFSYKYLTLSMLMVIRNLGPLVTLPIEWMVMTPEKRPNVNVQMILALLVVLASTLVYCHHLDISAVGCILALLNMVLAISDRVLQRRLLTTECQNLSTETCMLLNNLLGMIPTLILAFSLGELHSADWRKWFMSASTVLLVLSGLIGTGICYFGLAVQREITATSFMVLQNAVRMAVVIAGVVVFLDPISWPWQAAGIALSFVGTLCYGRAAVTAAQDRMAQQKEGTSKAPPEPAAKGIEKLCSSIKQGIPEKVTAGPADTLQSPRADKLLLAVK